MDGTQDEVNHLAQQPTPPHSSDSQVNAADTPRDNQSKRMADDDEAVVADMLSPVSAEGDKQEESELPALSSSTHLISPSMGYDFSNIRVCAYTCAIYTPLC